MGCLYDCVAAMAFCQLDISDDLVVIVGIGPDSLLSSDESRQLPRQPSPRNLRRGLGEAGGRSARCSAKHIYDIVWNLSSGYSRE